MIEIKKIENKELWNTIVSRQKFAQFLQSFEWGNFQEKLGKKVWRFFVKNNNVSFLTLLIKQSLPFSFFYFYSPRGPIFLNSETKEIPADFLIYLKELVKGKKLIFWRFEPVNVFNLRMENLIRTKDVQPAKTWILNLEEKEDELLKKMHYKTRYNIRLAIRRGVKIRCANEKTLENDIKTFLGLLHQTKKRHKFKPYSDSYYLTMIKELGKDRKFLKLYLAEYKGNILAANIVIFFGDTVTYLHGASSNKFRNLMAPHLLQWKTIQQAKASGYKYYDFWGIDEKKWPGITRFKKSFGGKEKNYLGTFDLVFNKKLYKIYQLIKRLKSPCSSIG